MSVRAPARFDFSDVQQIGSKGPMTTSMREPPTTIRHTNWLETPALTKAMTTRRQTGRRVVINPSLGNASEFIEDPYWKKILEEGAFGKFPRGFTFKRGVLNYRLKQKVTSYSLSENPQLMAQEIITIMQTVAGLKSDYDLEQEQRSYRSHLDECEIIYTSWGEIRNKKYQQSLIYQYVEKLYRYYHFSDSIRRQLKSELMLALNFGLLKGNVELFNGQIVAIHNISWNEETKKFYVVGWDKKSKSSKIKSRPMADLLSPTLKIDGIGNVPVDLKTPIIKSVTR